MNRRINGYRIRSSILLVLLVIPGVTNTEQDGAAEEAEQESGKCAQLGIPCNAIKTGAERLRQILVDDALDRYGGREKFADYLKEVVGNKTETAFYVEDTPRSINDELPKIVETIATKLTNRMDASKTLAVAAATHLNGKTGVANYFNRQRECCTYDYIPDTAFDPNFQTNVYNDSICYKRDELVTYGTWQVDLGQNFTDTCKANLVANPGIAWQYFATETGVSTVWPVSQTSDCDYDPRDRPWYTTAIRPSNKDGLDIVILVSNSQTMASPVTPYCKSGCGAICDRDLGRRPWPCPSEDPVSRIEAAKYAIKRFINSTNDNDRLALLGFHSVLLVNDDKDSSTGEYPCFRKNLAYATPNNKRILANFLDDMPPPSSGTDLVKPFERAYKLLRDNKISNWKKDPLKDELCAMDCSDKTRIPVIILIGDDFPSRLHSIIDTTQTLGYQDMLKLCTVMRSFKQYFYQAGWFDTRYLQDYWASGPRHVDAQIPCNSPLALANLLSEAYTGENMIEFVSTSDTASEESERMVNMDKERKRELYRAVISYDEYYHRILGDLFKNQALMEEDGKGQIVVATYLLNNYYRTDFTTSTTPKLTSMEMKHLRSLYKGLANQDFTDMGRIWWKELEEKMETDENIMDLDRIRVKDVYTASAKGGLFHHIGDPDDDKNLDWSNNYRPYPPVKEELSQKLLKLHTKLPDSDSANIVKWSVPYLDEFGLGMMMTAVYRVEWECIDQKTKVKGPCFGVSGVDVTMKDLMGEVMDFEKADGSYAIFFNHKTGIIMSHPFKPDPSSVDSEPTYIGMEVLEPELWKEINPKINPKDKSKNVYHYGDVWVDGNSTQSCSSDVHGQKMQGNFNTTRLEKNGLDTPDRTYDVAAQYVCSSFCSRPTNATESIALPFTICLIAMDDNEQSSSKKMLQTFEYPKECKEGAFEDFTYNNLQAYQDLMYNEYKKDKISDDEYCFHDSRLARRKKSGVKFPPSAFYRSKNSSDISSNSYVYGKENKEDVKKIVEQYCGGSSGDTPISKSTIAQARISAKLETFWRAGDEEGETRLIDQRAKASNIQSYIKRGDAVDIFMFILWRYIGTSTGATRGYPATEYYKVYDPTVRGWYQEAKRAKNDTVVVTAPYMDAFGGGEVVSIAKAMYNDEGVLFGVLSVDLYLIAMKNIVRRASICPSEKGMYGRKKECMLINDSGVVIWHGDFANAVRTFPIIDAHLINYYGRAARELIKDGVMEKTACFSYAAVTGELSYRIDLDKFDEKKDIFKDSSDTKKLVYNCMERVKGTNTILIVIDCHDERRESPFFADEGVCVAHYPPGHGDVMEWPGGYQIRDYWGGEKTSLMSSAPQSRSSIHPRAGGILENTVQMSDFFAKNAAKTKFMPNHADDEITFKTKLIPVGRASTLHTNMEVVETVTNTLQSSQFGNQKCMYPYDDMYAQFCEAPCLFDPAPNAYKKCKNTYDLEYHKQPPCSPAAPGNTNLDMAKESLVIFNKGLKTCYDHLKNYEQMYVTEKKLSASAITWIVVGCLVGCFLLYCVYQAMWTYEEDEDGDGTGAGGGSRSAGSRSGRMSKLRKSRAKSRAEQKLGSKAVARSASRSASRKRRTSRELRSSDGLRGSRSKSRSSGARGSRSKKVRRSQGGSRSSRSRISASGTKV